MPRTPDEEQEAAAQTRVHHANLGVDAYFTKDGARANLTDRYAGDLRGLRDASLGLMDEAARAYVRINADVLLTERGKVVAQETLGRQKFEVFQRLGAGVTAVEEKAAAWSAHIGRGLEMGKTAPEYGPADIMQHVEIRRWYLEQPENVRDDTYAATNDPRHIAAIENSPIPIVRQRVLDAVHEQRVQASPQWEEIRQMRAYVQVARQMLERTRVFLQTGQ